MAARHDLQRRVRTLEATERHLEMISPPAVLKRGYTITTRKRDGAIVRSANDPQAQERIITQFADGTVESIVQDRNQLPLFE
jgi:exonuclease VII large subunit